MKTEYASLVIFLLLITFEHARREEGESHKHQLTI